MSAFTDCLVARNCLHA